MSFKHLSGSARFRDERKDVRTTSEHGSGGGDTEATSSSIEHWEGERGSIGGVLRTTETSACYRKLARAL